MLTPEQHALRRTGITSSDITRIVGESPWGGPHDVYLEKMGGVDERVPTIAQRMGHALEPLVCELVAEQFRIELAVNDTVRHPFMPWVLSTPDRTVSGSPGVVEVKAKSTAFDRDAWVDVEAPPPWVLIQSQWHMIATRTPRCYVGALVGCKPLFWVVDANQDLQGTLLNEGERFHVEHVLARVPPPPNGSEGARKLLARLWPTNRGTMVKADRDTELLAKSYFEAKRVRDQAEKDLELARQCLIEIVEDADGIQGDGWRLKYTERAATEYVTKMPARRHFDLRTVKR